MTVGKCLCGNIEFTCKLDGSSIKIYQCHCSLCKRQSGSSSNSATIIRSEDFDWIKNKGIRVWKKDTGFNAHFCENCGCSVPNIFADKYYWIPVGLLDVEKEVQVVAHFCLSSKSSWHKLADDSENFAELPDFKKIMELLKNEI